MSSTPKFRREFTVAADLRAPPHSDEAEQAVLGGLMLDRARLGQRRRRGRARIISSAPITSSFSKASRRSRARRQPCDPVTVSEHLQRLGKLNDAGGLAYLGTLTRDTPGAANVRAYAGDRQRARAAARAGQRGRRNRKFGVERGRRERARSRWSAPSGASSPSPKARAAARDT